MQQILFEMRHLPILPKPSTPAPTAFDATTIQLTWANGDATATTEVSRDNVLIATVAAGLTQYSDGGRTSGIAYGYQLAHRKPTTGAYSPRTLLAYGYTALPAPVNLSGTASGQTANLAWTNTVAQQTRVYRGGALVATVASGVTTYADTLLADATYAYTVRHYDGVSESADSNTANVTIAAIPATPTGLAATAVSGGRNDLAWTPVDAVATAEVYRGLALNPTVLLGTAGANVGAYSDTTAVAGTTYHYRVRNLRGGFYSGYSLDVSAVTLGVGPTGPPTAFTVTTPNTDRASLAWTNGDAAATTEIWRGVSLLTTVAATVASYNDDTAVQSTAYAYKIRHLRNSQYSSYAATVSVTTPTPSIINTSMTGVVGDNFFTMNWTGGNVPRGVTYQLFAWTDLDGNFRTTPLNGIVSPLVETLATPDALVGFTITVKNPGVNHQVFITVTFKMKDSSAAVVMTDTTTFLLSPYKPGP